MLPQTAEYALRAVIWMASHPETSQTKDDMAKAAGVPPRYFYKVLQSLGRAGFVRSQPGPGGGYRLARPADEVTLLPASATVAALDRIIATELDKRSEHVREQLDDASWAELEEYISWWVVHGYGVRATERPAQ